MRASCGRSPARPAGSRRLKPESLAVLLGGRSIAGICAADPRGSAGSSTRSDSPTGERQIAERVLKEIQARLGFLLDVGLDYLPSTARRDPVRREAQRIRLAARSAPDWSACSMWTSRRSGCTSAGQPPAHRDLDPAA